MNTLPEADRRCAERAWMDRHDTAPSDTIDRYLEAQGLSVECRWDGRYRQRFRDLADAYFDVLNERGRGDGGAVTLTCAYCEEPFDVEPWDAGMRKHCSVACYDNARRFDPDLIERNRAIMDALANNTTKDVAIAFDMDPSTVRGIRRDYRRGTGWAQHIQEAA